MHKPSIQNELGIDSVESWASPAGRIPPYSRSNGVGDGRHTGGKLSGLFRPEPTYNLACDMLDRLPSTACPGSQRPGLRLARLVGLAPDLAPFPLQSTTHRPQPTGAPHHHHSAFPHSCIHRFITPVIRWFRSVLIARHDDLDGEDCKGEKVCDRKGPTSGHSHRLLRFRQVGCGQSSLASACPSLL